MSHDRLMTPPVVLGIVFVLAFGAASSSAAPIDYTFRTLADGVEAFDALSPTASDTDPAFAHFWTFSGDLADAVTITVRRQRDDFDPLFWVFQGLIDDTDDFGGAIDAGDPGFLFRQDDGLPPNGGGSGFGFDPQLMFALPSSAYTVIVVNGPLSSDEAEGSLGYSIVASGFENEPTPVPELSSALTLLAGLGALTLVRRGRRT
jgi:MYXO-CTERM domain-containing protein